MTIKSSKIALVIGLAGAFAIAASASSFAATKKVHPRDSYEAWGAKDGMPPPVPGFALSGYKPGMCWKVTNADRQFGLYVPCSEWRKKKE